MAEQDWVKNISGLARFLSFWITSYNSLSQDIWGWKGSHLTWPEQKVDLESHLLTIWLHLSQCEDLHLYGWIIGQLISIGRKHDYFLLCYFSVDWYHNWMVRRSVNSQLGGQRDTVMKQKSHTAAVKDAYNRIWKGQSCWCFMEVRSDVKKVQKT